MKKSLILVSLLAIQFCSFAQNEGITALRYEDYKFSGLDQPPTGNIHSLIEQQFKFNKVITDTLHPDLNNMLLQKMIKYELDKEKRSLTNYNYRIQDTLNYASTSGFRFDSLGNCIYSFLKLAGSNDAFTNTKLKYNLHGRVIERRSYQAGDILISWETRKYNKKNNLIENALFKPGRKGPTLRNVYTYDNNNNRLSATSYVDTNSSEYLEATPCIKNAEKYVSTDKGYLDKKIMEYKDNKLVHLFFVNRYGCLQYTKQRITYNNDGDKQQVITYDPTGGIVMQWTGKYINHLLVLETTIHGRGNYTPIDSIRRNYDSSGNLVEMISSSSTGNPYKVIKYTYDDFHNWVTKLTIINNKPDELIRRRITYHEK